MDLRPARPSEAALLSELALRSKAHWGYDPEFLELCRPVLTLRPGEVEPRRTVVADAGGQIQGFYTLDDGELGNLWIDPDHLRQGVGRSLWNHAVEAARALGLTELLIVADPHAEGFYRAMGAVRTGEVPSEVEPGRRLPQLRAR
ncbi:GNAT family N-acetyltransferase, partial [Actinoplanes sp. NPDC051411]|uniref:GNAT family N-acetyltransferase n=1 Tax=Actinoplanes sp. NPDC051411 TaxID=3155522 RepID=UPI0034246233